MNMTTLSQLEPQSSLDDLLEKANKAYQVYQDFSQQRVDEIFYKVAKVAASQRIDLAKRAVCETKMGVVEDKVIKNHFASEYVYHKYRHQKTCDIIEHNEAKGIYRVASPMGIIAGIIPCTNPTSTVIFKALLALKTRNAIVFSPHPRAKGCCYYTAELLQQAVVEAGGPDNLVSCLAEPTIGLTQDLLQHPNIAVILATGGQGLVHAAYCSGNPAIGVGAGNTPTVIDETADINMAVSSIVLSKTFDNGVVCASEQSMIVVDSIYEAFKTKLQSQGGYVLTASQKSKLGSFMVKKGRINPAIVGQSAKEIATLCQIEVAKTTKLLIAEVTDVGVKEPFSREKLSPVLALYRVEDFDQALSLASQLLQFQGAGHTSILYSNEGNHDRIERFGKQMKTARVLVNIPGSQGAIGDIYNFHLEPSLTLGCGSYGKNSISGNIKPEHLLNFKTVVERRENMLWFRVPPKIFFKYGCLPDALQSLKNFHRVFIISDRPLFDLGMLTPIEKLLQKMMIHYEIFVDVPPNPTLSVVHEGLRRLNRFNPDVILALGGGSPMDAAKIIWLMHDHPDVKFTDLASRFMDIRKRITSIDEFSKDKKTLFVAVPTTSGTGSEISPFSVITDDENDGVKYPIADYAITPDVAIIDPALVMDLPKSLTASSGIDAITHAIEAMASVMSTVFVHGLAKQALQLLFRYLPDAYTKGATDKKAREKVHYAATLAGMAFANSSLGIAHSMAHKLGEAFHIPHGVACGLCLPHVIAYNATNTPTKLVAFPQYKTPVAISVYAEIADSLGVCHTDDQPKVKVIALIDAIIAIKEKLALPKTLKEMGIDRHRFLAHVDRLAEYAFDDQCTPTNPRYPLISEIRRLLLDVYDQSRPKYNT